MLGKVNSDKKTDLLLLAHVALFKRLTVTLNIFNFRQPSIGHLNKNSARNSKRGKLASAESSPSSAFRVYFTTRINYARIGQIILFNEL